MLFLLNVLYLSSIVSADVVTYSGPGSENAECAPAPERTSKTWKPELIVEESGLNLATGGEPQLTLMVLMDTMYYNDTYVADDTYNFEYFSPRFSYPDFCGVNVPQNISARDYSHAPGDTSTICQTKFEVNMEYVKYCNFDVTDDAEKYKFSGHMLNEVYFRQTFLGDYIFQKFSRPIGFSVELPKILTVTTDITVINPDQCDTSADCNGQVCEDSDVSDPSTPKICKCDECHSGNFCETDTCAPQLVCPADVTIDACSKDADGIKDANGNAIKLLDRIAKASDTVAASDNPVVGTAAADLTWSRLIASAESTITGTYSSQTDSGIEWRYLTDDIDAQDGDWSYPAETVVKYCVKDAAQLESCCEFKVTVRDVCSARISCRTDVVQTGSLDDINTATFQGTADDNGLSNYAVSRTTGQFTTRSDGQVLINFCAQDSINSQDLNTAACCDEEYYLDQTDPVITCEDLVLLAADYTAASVSTELPEPATSDAGVGVKSGSLTTTALRSEYPTRTNEWAITRDGSVTGNVVQVFTFTVEDKVGNSNSCTSTVKVTDNLNPKVTCTPKELDDSDYTYDANGLFTTLDNDAIKSETSFDTKSYTWGEHTETVTVEDYHSNSVTVDCTVTRKDTTDPTITCPASGTVHTVNMDSGANSANVNSYVNGILSTANDNQEVASKEVTIDGVAHVAGTAFVLTPTTDDQEFTFVVTVKDKQVLSFPQNTKTCTFKIKVNDNQSPALTCPYPNGLEVNTDAGKSCGTPGTFNSLSGTDNAWYDADTEAYDKSATTCYEHGSVYTVTGSVSDKALNPANTDTCTFQISVKDNEDPVLTCTDVSDTLDHGQTYSTSVSFTTPTMADNVAVASATLAYSHSENQQFSVGSTTVTATVEDTSGNQGSCTFDVTISHSCGDGVLNYPTEQCDGSTGCASDCTCTTGYKDSTGGGCEVDCAFGYLNDGTCKIEEDCELEINTEYYTNSQPPHLKQCNYTDYTNNCNINTNDWDLPLVESTSLDHLQVIDMWVEWYPYGQNDAVTGTNQVIDASGEYAEVKVCCLDRPEHPLEALVFNDVTDETQFVDSVQDCIAKGHSTAAIRPVWAGVGTEPADSLDQDGCFYIPVCSGGVVVIGEKYDDPRLNCNANQESITVDLTTLAAGTANCAAVTAPTDFSGRFTVVADSDGHTPTASASLASSSQNGDCATTSGFDWTVGTHQIQFDVYFSAGTNPQGLNYLGSHATCTFNLIVTDKLDPTFVTCPADASIGYTSGQNSATFTPSALEFRDETDPSTDTSAPLPEVKDTASGAVLVANDDGSYTITAPATVTWTVTDTAGNQATCEQDITLSDSEGPVMTCADATYTAATGENTASAPLPTITCNDAVSGDCSTAAIGSVSVYTTTRYSGDTTNAVTYAITANIPARYVTDSPSYFEPGIAGGMYSYTATASDASGNPSSCTGYITIVSDQAPDVTCPSDQTIDLTSTSFTHQVVPNSADFSHSDNDGSSTLALSPSGSTTLSCKSGGTTSVTVSATTTERLHWATKTRLTDTCSYTVSIQDKSDPSIDCPTEAQKILVECPTAGCTTDSDWSKTTIDTPSSFFSDMINDATKSDNCDDSLTVTHNGATSYGIQNGHTVTLTATDDNGNTQTVQCQFDVEDKIPPRNTDCPANEEYLLSVVGTPYSYSLADHENQMVWSDNVQVAAVNRVSVQDSNNNDVTITNDAFTPVPDEVYTFTYTAVDTNQNQALSTCSWTLKVEDDVDPVPNCPSDATFEATGSQTAYTYQAPIISVSDNYNSASQLFFKWKVGGTYTSEASVPANGNIQLPDQGLPASYATLPSSHLFELKVRDAYNNVAHCSWTVKIEDTTDPAIDCSSVSNINIRPTATDSAVTATYPTNLGFVVSDIHAQQQSLDATVVLDPASGGQTYYYSTTGSNTHPVKLTVTDDQTTPNLDASNNACFNVVILEPYPPAAIDAALKSVRITTDDAGDFYADVVFVTGINWPHTLYARYDDVATDTSISYTGTETRSDEIQIMQTRETGTLQQHCAAAYTASANGFAVGSNCFQDWELKMKFGSCDAVDMQITINFKSECDNEGNGNNDCSLQSVHAVVFTFAAEDYCTKQLSDVEVNGSLKTYSSSSTTWTNFLSTHQGYDVDGVIVDLDDTPDGDTTFDPAAQVVALISVTSPQAIIKKITILTMDRTQCTDQALQNCQAAQRLINRPDKDSGATYNDDSTTSDASLKNNYAYGQYTEIPLNAGESAYVKLDAVVAIEYLLQAGGARRRSVLELEIMEANYPKNIAHLLPRARRSMTQEPLETNTQVAGQFVFNSAGFKDSNGPRSAGAEGGSPSDLPPYVIPAIITLLLVALCAACAVGCCCYYIGLKKRKDDKEFINESFDGDQDAGIQTNIYLSPNIGATSRV
jgi:hypothetical protein